MEDGWKMRKWLVVHQVRVQANVGKRVLNNDIENI